MERITWKSVGIWGKKVEELDDPSKEDFKTYEKNTQELWSTIQTHTHTHTTDIFITGIDEGKESQVNGINQTFNKIQK